MVVVLVVIFVVVLMIINIICKLITAIMISCHGRDISYRFCIHTWLVDDYQPLQDLQLRTFDDVHFPAAKQLDNHDREPIGNPYHVYSRIAGTMTTSTLDCRRLSWRNRMLR